MAASTILVQGHTIRTDWIYKIEKGKDKRTVTCNIWLRVGSVGVYTFTGRDAETALQLLASHPALEA